MPVEVDVKISQDGALDVTVASKVQLNVNKSFSNEGTRLEQFNEIYYSNINI